MFRFAKTLSITVFPDGFLFFKNFWCKIQVIILSALASKFQFLMPSDLDKFHIISNIFILTFLLIFCIEN